jgi:Ca2+-binding RTX toxin-like protein
MAGGDGTDTLQITGSGDLTLNGTSLISGFETLNGGSRSIVGTSSANVFDLSIFTTVTNLDGVEGLGGDDTLTGSTSADRLDGGSGTDTVRGGGGDDTIVVRTTEALNDIMDGGTGTGDRILVDGSSSLTLSSTSRITGVERLEGGGGAIVGTSGADALDFSAMAVSGISSIQGLDGADTIKGGTGADVLSGGLGNDTLTGGGGQDSFLFDSALTGNIDTIVDFNASNETIRLDRDIFTTLSTGTLTASAFFAGAAAHDSSDRIIFNAATGNVFYDRDGTGSAGAVQFAHLNGTLTLSNTNFSVVS